MKPFAAILFALASATAVSAAQPGLETLRAAWSAALDDWKAANVEADRQLFQRPPAEAAARIGDALARRRRLDSAKQQYITALARYYRTAARQWQEASSVPSAPPGEAGLQEALNAALEDLGRQIKTLPASSRDSAPVLERQRGELRLIQASLRARQEARGRAFPGASAAAGEVEAAVEAMLALANRLEAHQSTLRQEAAAWEQIYTGLKEELERRQPPPPVPAGPTGAAVPLGAEASAQAVVPSLAGVWFLQNLNARKTEDGAYEPRFVNVRITQQEDRVQGSYEAVYAVPEDEPHNPTVRFSFEGRITTEVLRFPLRSPLRGFILIERATPLRIRVSYSIENPEVRNISFGYVGADNPQDLQKKID